MSLCCIWWYHTTSRLNIVVHYLAKHLWSCEKRACWIGCIRVFVNPCKPQAYWSQTSARNFIDNWNKLPSTFLPNNHGLNGLFAIKLRQPACVWPVILLVRSQISCSSWNTRGSVTARKLMSCPNINLPLARGCSTRKLAATTHGGWRGVAAEAKKRRRRQQQGHGMCTCVEDEKETTNINFHFICDTRK